MPAELICRTDPHQIQPYRTGLASGVTGRPAAHRVVRQAPEAVHVANNHVTAEVVGSQQTPEGRASMKPMLISGICPGSRRGHEDRSADLFRLDDLKTVGGGPKAVRDRGVDLDDDEPFDVTQVKRDATTMPPEAPIRYCGVCGYRHSPAILADPVKLRAVHAANKFRVKRAIEALNAPREDRRV